MRSLLPSKRSLPSRISKPQPSSAHSWGGTDAFPANDPAMGLAARHLRFALRHGRESGEKVCCFNQNHLPRPLCSGTSGLSFVPGRFRRARPVPAYGEGLVRGREGKLMACVRMVIAEAVSDDQLRQFRAIYKQDI